MSHVFVWTVFRAPLILHLLTVQYEVILKIGVIVLVLPTRNLSIARLVPVLAVSQTDIVLNAQIIKFIVSRRAIRRAIARQLSFIIVFVVNDISLTVASAIFVVYHYITIFVVVQEKVTIFINSNVFVTLYVFLTVAVRSKVVIRSVAPSGFFVFETNRAKLNHSVISLLEAIFKNVFDFERWYIILRLLLQVFY